jgi:hypothetical protein
MDLLFSLIIGLGLAAACGFRVFVPFTVISIAALSGQLDLAAGFAWIGTYPALIAFATATVIEIVAYYVPWLDNLLDTIATPTAIVAGAVVTASVVGDMSPLLRWTLAAIAGGGMAAAVQSGTVLLRSASSVTTAGFGNFLVSTMELVGAVTTAILAVWLPVAALAFVLLVAFWLVRRRSGFKNRTVSPISERSV